MVTQANPAPRHHRILRGWRWWLFLAVWSVVFVLAAYGAWRYVIEAGSRITPAQLYGLQLREGGGDRPVFVQFPLGRDVMAQGVRAGDRVVTIAGRPVGGGRSVDDLLTAAGEPAAVDVGLASPTGIRHLRLRRSPSHARDGFGRSGISMGARTAARVAIFSLSLFVVPVGLAVLLLARRSADPLAPWVSLAMVLNALGSGPALYAASASETGPFGIAVSIACPLAGWAQIAILALFPETRLRSIWTRLVVLGALPLMYWMQVDSSVFETNTALLVGQFAAVAVVVRRYLAMPPGVGRQQIRWALFGFGASLAAQALTIIVQTLFFATANAGLYVWLNLLADVLAGLSVVLLFGAMTLGLLRYRLYDADATISRSIAYGALTLALLAIFAGSEKVIEALGEEYLGGSLGALANGIGAAVAAAMIGPLHHRVTHWAEERFRSGLVHLRHGLPLLVGDMRETAPSRDLADTMLMRVEKGVRARHGAVVVHGNLLDARDVEPPVVLDWLARTALPAAAGALSCDRTDPVFPLRVPLRADGCGLIGWLLLGPRPDGTFYGRDERETLADIADPVARALAIAVERERREAVSRERDEVRDRRFEALRRFVQERFGFDVDASTGRIATI